jgi:hypothetical protein
MTRSVDTNINVSRYKTEGKQPLTKTDRPIAPSQRVNKVGVNMRNSTAVELEDITSGVQTAFQPEASREEGLGAIVLQRELR